MKRCLTILALIWLMVLSITQVRLYQLVEKRNSEVLGLVVGLTKLTGGIVDNVLWMASGKGYDCYQLEETY